MDSDKQPSMQIFEHFMYKLAKLFIEEYKDDMHPYEEHGIFSTSGLETMELEEVQQHFLDNWNLYIPDAEKIAKLIVNTIGSCHHITHTLIPYDDVVQRALCEKIGEVFTEDLLAHLEGECDIDEPVPSTSGIASSSVFFTSGSASGSVFLSRCLIHSYHPVPHNYVKFCHEFTNLMFHNLIVLTSDRQKQILYNKMKADEGEDLAENYLNLYCSIANVWSELLPTPHQTDMMVRGIYGPKYKIIQNHIVPRDFKFRDDLTWKLTEKARRYFKLRADIYEATW